MEGIIVMANNYEVFRNTIVGGGTQQTETITLPVVQSIGFEVLSTTGLLFSINEGSGFGDNVFIRGGGFNSTYLTAKEIRITNDDAGVGEYQIIAQSVR